MIWQVCKHNFLAGEEMLPLDQSQITQQAKFICFPYGKAFEKQTQTIKEHGDKQTTIKYQRIKHVKALESLRFSKK